MVKKPGCLLTHTYQHKECLIIRFLRENTMNKSELIEAVAHEMNISPREASDVVSTILDSMCESLAGGNTIEIRGFGSFVIKDYGSYLGRNPKTGEKIKVPPKRLPFFKVGKELREQVNTNKLKYGSA